MHIPGLYKQKNSSIWWAKVTHQGHVVRRSTGTDDQQEAKRFLDELKAELWKAPPSLKGHTWGKAVIHWCSLETRSDSELLSLGKFARHFPDRRLSDVTREAVDQALQKFCTTAGTYTRYRTMIAAILNAAKEEKWLTTLPKLIVRRDKKKKEAVWITSAQWEVLYSEMPAHMKPMAEFSVETGLRQDNVLQLRWERVDLERQCVWVEAHDTKGDSAIAVPLSRRAVEVLKGQVGGNAEYVFTYQGRPIKEVKTAWQAACVRAKLGRYVVDENKKSHYEGFKWHGLRHTWATWHVQNGTPIEVLQKLGGWKDLRMVMRYAHHSPGYLANFANNTRPK
ncbi:MAG: site-specific integrase [Proteobacteria bacterium]|nr:site-specific integrase [Pseudomonadota bacterium]